MLKLRTLPTNANANNSTYIMMIEKSAPKTDYSAALNWLDLKIFEYSDKCSDRRYAKSKRGIADCAEITGVLKFIHMARLMDDEQCAEMLRRIVSR